MSITLRTLSLEEYNSEQEYDFDDLSSAFDEAIETKEQELKNKEFFFFNSI